MRDYREETEKRIAFIRQALQNAHADGIVYGNSGGKDCTLVSILCKMACDNTVGVIMPCGSSRNFGEDKSHAEMVAQQFGIENRIVDITGIKAAMIDAIEPGTKLNDMALGNIAPRLRMTTLYAVAAAENRLVAGTGNRSEYYMGYFTKWGDGACDLNPIADLTVTEVYEYLRYLGAPEEIIGKAPSAGLFEGQTDEDDMGVTYRAIDEYITQQTGTEKDVAIIRRYHDRSEHKRRNPLRYGE